VQYKTNRAKQCNGLRSSRKWQSIYKVEWLYTVAVKLVLQLIACQLSFTMWVYCVIIIQCFFFFFLNSQVQHYYLGILCCTSYIFKEIRAKSIARTRTLTHRLSYWSFYRSCPQSIQSLIIRAHYNKCVFIVALKLAWFSINILDKKATATFSAGGVPGFTQRTWRHRPSLSAMGSAVSFTNNWN